MIPRRRSGQEDGYSLVEVMVSIFILGVAIIPMVAMFDMGLDSATSGANYDTARSLANTKLEDIKALPYSKPGGAADSVVELYPPCGAATTQSAGNGFAYAVQTTYVKTDLTSSCPSSRSQMRVQVKVTWSSNEYTATGMASR